MKYRRINASLRWVGIPSVYVAVDIEDADGFTIAEWLVEIDKFKRVLFSEVRASEFYVSYFVVMDAKTTEKSAPNSR